MSELRPADHAARDRALDVGASFIVQAPAGSGKTELLIQRCLALLATLEEPESLLAITFTRKAAAEMRERILGALREVQSPGSGTARLEPRTRALASAALAADARHRWGLIGNPGTPAHPDHRCLEPRAGAPVARNVGAGSRARRRGARGRPLPAGGAATPHAALGRRACACGGNRGGARSSRQPGAGLRRIDRRDPAASRGLGGAAAGRCHERGACRESFERDSRLRAGRSCVRTSRRSARRFPMPC